MKKKRVSVQQPLLRTQGHFRQGFSNEQVLEQRAFPYKKRPEMPWNRERFAHCGLAYSRRKGFSTFSCRGHPPKTASVSPCLRQGGCLLEKSTPAGRHKRSAGEPTGIPAAEKPRIICSERQKYSFFWITFCIKYLLRENSAPLYG